MLLDFLSQYLIDVEAAVRKLKGAYVERYEEEIVAVPHATIPGSCPQGLAFS